jgi:hypothetical protein
VAHFHYVLSMGLLGLYRVKGRRNLNEIIIQKPIMKYYNGTVKGKCFSSNNFKNSSVWGFPWLFIGGRFSSIETVC